MKKIIFASIFIFFIASIFIFLISSISFAKDIQLTCDPNTESDLAGYRIYQSNTSGDYNKTTDKVSEVAIGPNTQPFFDITDLVEDGRTVYFVATAFDTNGNESGFSNELSYTVQDTTAPQPPSMLSIVQQIANALTSIANNGLKVVVTQQ